MADSKKISRRDALKIMGAAAVGTGLGLNSLGAAEPEKTRTYKGKLKVLLVNGSPNEKGCTCTALSEIGKTLESNGIGFQHFWIGRKPLSGCLACGGCRKTGKCVINDRVNEFLSVVPPFDGYVFGSPVHFAGMTGAMTSFLDRAFFCDRATNYFNLKPGATVTSCRRSGSTTTLDQLNKYLIHRGMPIVPSQYWPMVYGNTPDEVRQDREGLQIMRTLAQNMAWMLKSIAAARQAGIAKPVYEKRIGTNFIR